MVKIAVTVLLAHSLVLPACAQAQLPAVSKIDLLEGSGFTEQTIREGSEQIVYYRRGPSRVQSGRLFVYLQGSDPSPQFSYRVKNNKIETLNWVPRDYLRIRPIDTYVVIEKPGFSGVSSEPISVPAEFYDKNSLDDRVLRANAVINSLVAQGDFRQVVVYGHSEGAPVAAKLATVNGHITHLGFWAGSALPDLFDFALQMRIEVHAGETTASNAQNGISEMLDYFETRIATDSMSTKVDDFGYTNKRWMSFAEPPINHLVKLHIPLFVQVATQDESVPVESSVLIPLEFARLGKENLEYRVCVGCDHGFYVTDDRGERIRKWDEIFDDFVRWIDDGRNVALRD